MVETKNLIGKWIDFKMHFEVTINKVNSLLYVFIQQYINSASHFILYIAGGHWIIIEGCLLIIQQRECDLVINGSYIRIATYGKLNVFVQWHLAVWDHVPN